ncbi:MAG TPA: YbjN domain-containing protein [Candidatus Polarisedimenticolia bacterium]|nr:YbjN domain-containing protein [Candidatus Polarisedimenticolia bacterium]
MPSDAVGPESIEGWLSELGLEAVGRAEREDVVSWDVVLDGRRRFDLRITLILDPSLGLVCWAHLAPPIGDGLRRSYRTLLRWNDEFPFAKFSLSDDGRPILACEIDFRHLDRDELGLTLARLVGIADRLLDETKSWIWIGGRMPDGYGQRAGRNEALLGRYTSQLPELLGS